MNKKDDKKEDTFRSGEVISMLENMNDGIQIIAEQQTDLVKKIDKMQVNMDKIRDNMDKMQDDVTEIKYKLSEKVDRDEFKKLEKRVIKLERLGFAK